MKAKKVMLFGTFDLIHSGHLSLFNQAKEYGQKLIVYAGILFDFSL